MDAKIFWLIGFILIGPAGAALIFARRYKNQDENAGSGVAAWMVFLLLLWLLGGLKII